MELQNSNDRILNSQNRILNSQNRISQLGQTYASKKLKGLSLGMSFQV